MRLTWMTGALFAGLLPGAQAHSQDASLTAQLNAETLAAISHQGLDNSSIIRQDGAGLSATVNVLGQGNKALDGSANKIEQSGLGSTAEVNVIGDFNAFGISQSGSAGPAQNDAAIDIFGSNNRAQINQLNDLSAPYANSAYIMQAGIMNDAAITQTVADSGGGAAFGTINMASVFQSGDDNFAEITQTGTGNEALIDQNGSNNSGTIMQQGAGSSLKLSQFGDYNSYVMMQTGCLVSTCAAIEITQSGGGSFPPPN